MPERDENGRDVVATKNIRRNIYGPGSKYCSESEVRPKRKCRCPRNRCVCMKSIINVEEQGKSASIVTYNR